MRLSFSRSFARQKIRPLQKLVVSRNSWDQGSALLQYNFFFHDLLCRHRTSDPGQIEREKPLLLRSDNSQSEKLLSILFRRKGHWTEAENSRDFLHTFSQRVLELLRTREVIYSREQVNILGQTRAISKEHEGRASEHDNQAQTLVLMEDQGSFVKSTINGCF